MKVKLPEQMSERQKWALVWCGWAAFFIGAESAALASKHPHAPLSSHLRWLFGVHKKSKLGKVVFVGFFAWLAAHLW
jgi:hypothetical protein